MKLISSALLGAGLLVLGACSFSVGDKSVSQEELEKTVTSQVTGVPDPVVSCDGEIKGEVDAIQDCMLTSGDSRVGLQVTVDRVEDDKAFFALLPFLPAEDLTEGITTNAAGGFTDIACGDKLLGEVGNSVRCTAKNADGEDTELDAKVTNVNGLTVMFNFTEVTQ